MPCGRLYIKDGGGKDNERFLERGLEFERETQRLCDRRSSPRRDFRFHAKGFDYYAWSIRTLDRRLRYFDIIKIHGHRCRSG